MMKNKIISDSHKNKAGFIHGAIFYGLIWHIDRAANKKQIINTCKELDNASPEKRDELKKRLELITLREGKYAKKTLAALLEKNLQPSTIKAIEEVQAKLLAQLENK